MKIYAACMSCFINQIEKAIRLTAPGTPEKIIVDAQQKLMEEIVKMDLKNISNVVLAALAYQIVSKVTGLDDPYKKMKKKYNKIAMDMESLVRKLIKESDDPLITAVRCSILGNSVDLGSPHEINLEKEFRELRKSDLGGADNLKQFIKSLKNADKIMILGDNCGEIVFDKLFVEEILEIFPDKKIIYSVRRGPIINDATLLDAKLVGIDKICKIVETSATPGVILEKSTSEFIDEFNSADLILSKGQGNFEALIDTPTETEIYFLLKAKCNLMTRIFNLPLGSLILVRKNQELIEKVT
ncbi:MAG: damage-control phosphatase ARMT1 family protein [Promethearchaeota archaeon]